MRFQMIQKRKPAASKLLSGFLAVSMAAAVLVAPMSVSAADAVVVADNFDGYSQGPLTIGSGNTWSREGTAPVLNVVQNSETGNSYVEISHDATGSSYIGQRFAAQSGGMILEFDVNLPTNRGGTFWVMDGRVNATNAAVMRYQMDGGVIKRHNGTSQINYNTEHWYRFKIVFNVPKRNYTVEILNLNTGEKEVWPETFYSDRARISSFGFFVNAGGGRINLDNVKVTSMDLALSQLQVQAGGGFSPELLPAFDPRITQYQVDVPSGVNQIQLIPGASFTDGVNLKVNGTLTSEGAGVEVPLSGQVTPVTVEVQSKEYPDIAMIYTVQVNKLTAAPQLNHVQAFGKDSSVQLGWEETIDPAYQEARIYRIEEDSSLTLVDTVPKGKRISTVAGLANGITYRFHVKGAYLYAGQEAAVESAGVEVQAQPVKLPARQMETLDRGLVAVPTDGGIYVGWRQLGTEPPTTGYNLYRNGTKVNGEVLTGPTNYLDPAGTADSVYTIRAVVQGNEQQPSSGVKPWSAGHLDIPLRKPADGVTVAGQAYSYRANDVAVGDLDGDGEYEIILKWDPTNSQDNSVGGYTGNTYVDAYKLDGTFMWRLDMGPNIRSGAHYLHMMVYDLDGDGKAEVALRTADGTIDGQGTVIGDSTADYRNSSGYVLSGPEFFTIFEGATGKALVTENYEPARGNVGDWGDTYGNRVDRFGAAIAYLDGERPSVVFQRGYYTRTVLVAYNWRDGQLSKVWTFDTNTPSNGSYAGQGNHQLSVGDVDGDGKDEILLGAATIDHNGTGLWNSGLGHGDAMHLGDFDPERLGLEFFGVQENAGVPYSSSMKDARTGRILYGQLQIGQDVGRGLTADVDPRHLGAESWSIDGAWNSSVGSMFNAKGEKISTSIPSSNFAIWWDGDLTRELLDHSWLGDPLRVGIPKIDKWNYEEARLDNIVTFHGTYSNNDTKGNPSLQADLLGDWREEVLVRTEDSTALRLFTTTELTQHKIHTLMHDPIYRLAIAWQNTGYNQPPHTGFYLGTGMETPPAPNIYLVGGTVTPPPAGATSVTLKAPEQIRKGMPFSTVLGLKDVLPEGEQAESGAVYAQDITLTYDPSVVEFRSAEALPEGVELLDWDVKEGTVRLILFSKGDAAAVRADGDILKLNWLAKANSASDTAALTVTRMLLANGEGATREAAGTNVSIGINPVQIDSLLEAITAAQSKLSSAVEGSGLAEYYPGSKARLAEALAAAKAVADNVHASEGDIEEALGTLQAAVYRFTSATGDVDHNGAISIGDLGFLARYYDLNSSYAGWASIAHADLDGDGKIGLTELIYVARKILQQ